jgi:hypothetical protein
MTEAYDYDPAEWRGHDFTAARRAYDRHVGSSYADASAKKISARSLIAPKLTSAAQRPLIVVIDETGSMGEWPATMFSKLPYLDHEVRWYLGEDAEIAFMAIGDAQNGEKYPLQVQPFMSGTKLVDSLKSLVIEGNGGGNGGETYELAALYLLHNLEVDPSAQPVVIFIGDEPCFNSVSVSDAKNWSQVSLERSLSTADVFGDLKKKASVYFIHKPYGHGSGSDDDQETRRVRASWSKLVGDDHIAPLGDPNRVVDVIFGILAAEMERFEDFQKEIEDRQKPAQVKLVYKSLATIHALQTPRKALGTGKSRMFTPEDFGEEAPPVVGS